MGKRDRKPVLGVHAPRARPTVAGAFWLACVITLPVGGIAVVVELLIRWML